MPQIWKKKDSKKTNEFFQKYTTGTDFIIDMQLFPFDIKANRAHVKMLQKIKIITADELKKLLDGFDRLMKKYDQGEIKITFEDEDCHTVIENEMIKICGDIAKKIHTGRSRNDQVLVAVRLYTINKLQLIKQKLKELLLNFANFAKKHQGIPFPGYTHTRQAMLSSIDHYFISYLDLLLDDYEYVKFAIKQTSKNPLGTGAGYGSSFPVDREFTTQELGFKKTQINSLSTQNSRGKTELTTMDALVQIMISLGKFSNDMVVFTVEEMQCFTLAENITTGSSMMPQKRNPDGCELIRGNTNIVIGHQTAIQGICKNLFTGYNRDTQLIKKPFFDSLDLVLDSIQLTDIILKNITVNPKNIEKNISKEMFATDLANDLVKEKNMSFRDAYREAMDQLQDYQVDLQKNLKSKISWGGPGNTGFKVYEKLIDKLV